MARLEGLREPSRPAGRWRDQRTRPAGDVSSSVVLMRQWGEDRRGAAPGDLRDPRGPQPHLGMWADRWSVSEVRPAASPPPPAQGKTAALTEAAIGHWGGIGLGAGPAGAEPRYGRPGLPGFRPKPPRVLSMTERENPEAAGQGGADAGAGVQSTPRAGGGRRTRTHMRTDTRTHSPSGDQRQSWEQTREAPRRRDRSSRVGSQALSQARDTGGDATPASRPRLFLVASNDVGAGGRLGLSGHLGVKGPPPAVMAQPGHGLRSGEKNAQSS